MNLMNEFKKKSLLIFNMENIKCSIIEIKKDKRTSNVEDIMKCIEESEKEIKHDDGENFSTIYFLMEEEYNQFTKKELERIHKSGRIPIIEVDTMGAIEINKSGLEANFLFVYPPSFEELRKRIGNRIETEEEFKKRIELAIHEIELANNSVLFTNRLANDNLEKAIDQFFTLIEALYF